MHHKKFAFLQNINSKGVLKIDQHRKPHLFSLSQTKRVELTFKRYFVDALGAMGVGLFASLITGLILKTIGSKAGIPILVEFGGLASSMVGPAIAVAIAQALRAPAMVVFFMRRRRFLPETLGEVPWALFSVRYSQRNLAK